MAFRKRKALLESYSNNELEYRILKFYASGKKELDDYNGAYYSTTIPANKGGVKIDSKANLQDAFERLHLRNLLRPRPQTSHRNPNDFYCWEINAEGRRIISKVNSVWRYQLNKLVVKLRKNALVNKITLVIITSIITSIITVIANNYLRKPDVTIEQFNTLVNRVEKLEK
jgi:hypothetical protein